MALSVSDLARLRRAIDELTTANYSDDALNALFDETADFNLTVAAVWDEKAARASSLVDTSEGQSSRKMSQVATSAMKMSEVWRGRVDGDAARGTGRARTRPIERV
jgi:uncharacterized protein YoxC